MPNSGPANSDIAKPATATVEIPIRAEMAIDPSGMSYTVVLTNTTGHPVAFFDDLSDDSQYSLIHSLWRAGPTYIRVRDSAGLLLTSNEYHADGWWDPSIVSSQARSLPITMSELRAHEQRSYTSTIQSACMGCPSLWNSKTSADFRSSLVGKQIQLQVQVYYFDPFLKTALITDSERITIR